MLAIKIFRSLFARDPGLPCSTETGALSLSRPRILLHVLRVLEQQDFSKWFLDSKNMKSSSEELLKAFTLTSNMYRQSIFPLLAVKGKPLCAALR